MGTSLGIFSKTPFEFTHDCDFRDILPIEYCSLLELEFKTLNIFKKASRSWLSVYSVNKILSTYLVCLWAGNNIGRAVGQGE